ncbi:threonine/serine exporter family protein [Clostridium thermarum]|uniref:threonine/serine exporter family protein n=1 Tax=Clostridium thermarum TaxID=1716543 RepID=UPI0011222AB6|nr:threonine/serine exporter family protein [Clostridium thermarum]
MVLQTLYAIMASLGFAIIFNIKGKNIIYASLGGGLGWLIYIFCQEFNFSTTASMFMASLAIGTYSEIMARVIKAPVTVFVVCALIPLVPGGGMYYTMLESITGNVDTALKLGIDTLSNAGALAVGVLLTSSISRLMGSSGSK